MPSWDNSLCHLAGASVAQQRHAHMAKGPFVSPYVGCELWHAPLVRLVFHLVRRLLLSVRHGWTNGRSHSLNMPDLVLFSGLDTPTYLRV